ncbi:MAG: serine/threonine-protein kinase [Pirellulaceae bacterium]
MSKFSNINQSRFQRAETLFWETIHLDEIARQHVLDEHCCDDDELKQIVGKLLKSDTDFNSSTVSSILKHGTQLFELNPQFSNLEVIRKLGEGGMGSVYLAKQTNPIERLVAVKVVRAGMDSNQILARFDSERRVLAMFNHPNLTQIHEAGVSADGQPYFIMEYVDGCSICEYADARKLSINNRIELMVQVCDAIQHAHQKGIIHRDIKPSNILVSETASGSTPKVIDFGIAKAIEETVSSPHVTLRGDYMGTPHYMSPEQACKSRDSIDSRSDIFSLGAVLFQLLSGHPPLTKKLHETTNLLHVLEMVRDQQPVSLQGNFLDSDSKEEIASQRSTSPASLSRSLRGELDWICRKAMATERDERYTSAAAFADDLRDYLRGNPISAAAPSTLYYSKKWLRKYRYQAGVSLIVVVTLVFLTIFSMLQARDAKIAQRKNEDLVTVLVKEREKLKKAIDRAESSEKLERKRLEVKRVEILFMTSVFESVSSVIQENMNSLENPEDLGENEFLDLLEQTPPFPSIAFAPAPPIVWTPDSSTDMLIAPNPSSELFPSMYQTWPGSRDLTTVFTDPRSPFFNGGTLQQWPVFNIFETGSILVGEESKNNQVNMERAVFANEIQGTIHFIQLLEKSEFAKTQYELRAREFLGLLYRKTGDFENAIKQLQNADQLYPFCDMKPIDRELNNFFRLECVNKMEQENEYQAFEIALERITNELASNSIDAVQLKTSIKEFLKTTID